MLSNFICHVNKNLTLIELIHKVFTDTNIIISDKFNLYKVTVNQTIHDIKDAINVNSIALYFSDDYSNQYNQMISELKKIQMYIEAQLYLHDGFIINYKFLLFRQLNNSNIIEHEYIYYKLLMKLIFIMM